MFNTAVSLQFGGHIILNALFVYLFPLLVLDACSKTPLTRTLVIRFASFTDQFGRSAKFVENSMELNFLVFRSSTVLCYGIYNFKSAVIEKFRRRHML